MRHFISQSLIMAELQLQHEVEPQLLNGDDLNEEREDADTSESLKKKRRKKKRNKASAPGKRHHFAIRNRGGNSAKFSPLVPLDREQDHQICGTGDFSTCQRVFLSSYPNSERLLLYLKALIWKRDIFSKSEHLN